MLMLYLRTYYRIQRLLSDIRNTIVYTCGFIILTCKHIVTKARNVLALNT